MDGLLPKLKEDVLVVAVVIVAGGAVGALDVEVVVGLVETEFVICLGAGADFGNVSTAVSFLESLL